MCHIHQQVGAYFVGDGAVARPVHNAAVGGEAANDHLGLVLTGQRLKLLVVDLTGVVVEAVLDSVVVLAGEIGLGTVGQVTTVGQTHTENRVAGSDQRLEHG